MLSIVCVLQCRSYDSMCIALLHSVSLERPVDRSTIDEHFARVRVYDYSFITRRHNKLNLFRTPCFVLIMTVCDSFFVAPLFTALPKCLTFWCWFLGVVLCFATTLPPPLLVSGCVFTTGSGRDVRSSGAWSSSCGERSL